MNEPLTSLIQRELAILSKNFGGLQRTCWELSRLLLRAREEYDMTSVNKGKSGAKSDGAGPLPESGSAPDEPRWLQGELYEGRNEGSERSQEPS